MPSAESDCRLFPAEAKTESGFRRRHERSLPSPVWKPTRAWAASTASRFCAYRRCWATTIYSRSLIEVAPVDVRNGARRAIRVQRL